MCLTLTQYYIACGHTNVCFVDCDDHGWHPEHRADGLRCRRRDHSVRKAVAHSYPTDCPDCAQAVRERVSDILGIRGLAMWRTVAEALQNARGGGRSGEGGYGREPSANDHSSGDAGLSTVPSRRTGAEVNATVSLYRNWRLGESRNYASSSRQVRMSSTRESGLSAARPLPPWCWGVFPAWQFLRLDTEMPEEEALRSLCERLLESCLLRTRDINRRLTLRSANGVIDRMISRGNDPSPGNNTWNETFEFRADSFDRLYTLITAVITSTDERIPANIANIFSSIVDEHQSMMNNTEIDPGGEAYWDDNQFHNGLALDFNIELQVLTMAWFIVLHRHIGLAAQVVRENDGLRDLGRPIAQEIVMNLGCASYLYFIRDLPEYRLVSAATLAVAWDSFTPSANYQHDPYRPSILGIDILFLMRWAMMTLSSVPRYSIRPFENSSMLSVLRPRDPPTELTSLDADFWQSNVNIIPTHNQGGLSRDRDRQQRGESFHGDSPRPFSYQDTLVTSHTYTVLFHFAGCGHHNAVNIERLRLHHNQRVIVAQCRCFEFPDKLWTEQKAWSLRSCLFCRSRSASRSVRDSVDDEWKTYVLRRQARMVTDPREIDAWPLVL